MLTGPVKVFTTEFVLVIAPVQICAPPSQIVVSVWSAGKSVLTVISKYEMVMVPTLGL